jgi:hypothetical protein
MSFQGLFNTGLFEIMENYPREMQEVRRGYQAEVYLALATVVQAITLTAVGSDIVLALKELQFPDLLWVFSTGFLSLLLCISFWYIFVRDYFFGFRVLPLSA